MKKKNYKIKKCIYCGEGIKKGKTESIPSYEKRKFCSISCQHKWVTKNKTKNIKCDFCGKEFRRRQSHIKEHNFCSLQCLNNWRHLQNSKAVVCDWCGKSFRKVKSQLHTKRNFCSRKCFGEWQSKFIIGESSYNWRDGADTINHRIRNLKKNIEWRLKVFKRDNYTCQKCGDKRGGNLNAHHIKPFSLIIKENNIMDILDAIKCKELWDISNGITLCEKCHIGKHKKQ